MTGHAILFPEGETVLVGDDRVLIRPVALAHFDTFAKLASDVLALLNHASIDQIHGFAERQTGRLQTMICNCTDMDTGRAAQLPASVAIQLFAEIIRVNADFFGQALPALVAALERVGQQSSTS